MSRVGVLVLGLVLARSAAAAPPSIDIDEHLGARLPLGLPFVDQDGHARRLGDAFSDGKPLVMVLAYVRCPMLCDLVLREVATRMAAQGLQLGRDFRALTVSIDPKDTPAAATLKQQGLLQATGQLDRAAAWPFWTGREVDVRTLAAALGFAYTYDARSDQYAHPACAFVLTPDGRIARYLYGVDFRPLDLRLAVDEAARGRVGSVVDRVLLACFRYDPTARRYSWYVNGILRGGATLTLLVVGGMLALAWRGERRRRAA